MLGSEDSDQPYLGDVGVQVLLLASGVGPVVSPAPVLHPVDQTDQVLAVGLQVVSQGAGALLVHHDQLGHVAEDDHVQHGGLSSEEELLLSQHLAECLQVLLAEVLDLLRGVDAHSIGSDLLQTLQIMIVVSGVGRQEVLVKFI